MLVLSRRINEKIVFPDLNIIVQVAGIKGTAVRLGITAPPDVTVLRAEVPDRTAEWGADRPQPAAEEAPGARLNRAVRGRLQVTRTGLAEVRRQLEAGRAEAAQLLLDKIEEDVALLQERLGEPPAPPPPAPRRRALLVEDDRNTCQLLAECLRLAGLEVDTAGDGVAALDYLRTHSRPDVMLLDMVLPRCDGPTTLRAIRRDPAYAGLPVFGLSGHSRDEFDLESGPNGVNGWYQKPFDPQALLRDLDRTLNHSTNRLQPATASNRRSGAQAARKETFGVPGTGRSRQGT
jgi:carbon storage regulator CsrA